MNQPCLVCYQPVATPFLWRRFLSGAVFRKQYLQPPEEGICPTCLREIEFLNRVKNCQRCSRDMQKLEGKFHYEYGEGKICYDCLRWIEVEKSNRLGAILNKNRSAFTYNDWAQELLHVYKFRGDTRLAYFLASTMVYTCLSKESSGSYDLVIPIPLTFSRLHERGFNQAALLAQLVAQFGQWQYSDELLLNQGNDQKQSKKGRADRLEDLLQKFVKNPSSTVDIYGKNILVVDDIYTTGATLYTAAYVLKSAGARSVDSLTAAR